MNKKGFIITSLLYPILVGVTGVFTLLFSVTKVDKILNHMKLDVNNSIFDSATCDCEAINNALDKDGERIITLEKKIKEIEELLNNAGNAKAGEILNGKTALVGGKLVTGTMANNPAVSGAVSTNYDISTGNLHLQIKPGAYITNSSSGYPEITIATSQIGNLFDIRPEIIKMGEEVLGVTGTFTKVDKNAAEEAYVLAGMVAYVNGRKITGALEKKGPVTNPDGEIKYDLYGEAKGIYIPIPKGAYAETLGEISHTYWDSECIASHYVEECEYTGDGDDLECEDVEYCDEWDTWQGTKIDRPAQTNPLIYVNREKLGITADKILKGQSIAGIAGTATDDTNANADEIAFGASAYVKGKKIVGTGPRVTEFSDVKIKYTDFKTISGTNCLANFKFGTWGKFTNSTNCTVEARKKLYLNYKPNEIVGIRVTMRGNYSSNKNNTADWDFKDFGGKMVNEIVFSDVEQRSDTSDSVNNYSAGMISAKFENNELVLQFKTYTEGSGSKNVMYQTRASEFTIDGMIIYR